MEKQAVPAVPPFAIPTWIRPIVGVGDNSMLLAGGWTSAQQFDVRARRTVSILLPACLKMPLFNRLMTAISGVLKISTSRGLILLGWRAKPHVMGVINTTPDSFPMVARIWRQPLRLQAVWRCRGLGHQLLMLVAVTRPGAEKITRNQELARAMPPIVGCLSKYAYLLIPAMPSYDACLCGWCGGG